MRMVRGAEARPSRHSGTQDAGRLRVRISWVPSRPTADHDASRGWENMFIPNGAGTAEWRLGWAADVPRGYFMLVLPLETPVAGLEVPTGVLSSTSIGHMSQEKA
ncbi:hypothetical protein ACFWWT_47500 [Streptomyces sp. NPDC058676]|uniref:hypothetical protein n=1 Tax=unclassified Streptomyces TaxID=2593676 RepID=UPI00366324F3